MTRNAQLFHIRSSESTQDAASLLVRVKRTSGEVQIRSASLLALTWPWNKAPCQTHFELWEQTRQQADYLWQAFRQLQAIRAEMPAWQQDSIKGMRSHVQTLVMGIGIAFQYVDEGSDALANPAYRSLIRTVYDSAVCLSELTSQAHEDLAHAPGVQAIADNRVQLALA